MVFTIVVGSLLLWYCTITVAIAAQGRDLWGVAKNNTDNATLQSALDWCCGAGSADCGPIQKGSPCYDPSDFQRTASFAFSNYYLKCGPSNNTCNFGGTTALTSLNPSHTNCKFPSNVSSIGGNYSGPATVGSGNGMDLSSSGSPLGSKMAFGSPAPRGKANSDEVVQCSEMTYASGC